ncbi:FecR family protein [Adhaeribacter radiodurans]|uniref:FecR domain-containing protein n=1 Tax=Adhaeribacter radiodurans TaxID=2745197 RepID=A0A7L7LAL1_9BACT|nr:FecR domain-containing protein [Adhaeribacter radiodurans]QMU29860.1 FecR domain-containing protein [Adhaeribacter radiodurans]
MNLPDYTLQDFLQDTTFPHWVYKTNPVEEQRWSAWLEANPDKKIVAQQAALMLIGISVVPTPIPDSQVQESWQRLKHRLAFQENAELLHPGKTTNRSYQQWSKWAAAFILFCLGGALFYYATLKEKQQIYRTNYGETATLILPDSSMVVLNGNTTLRYPANWNSRESREVWLEGEAFFNVLKKPGKGNAKFTVHTPEVNVQVLGTSFNVTNRRQKTRVVLNSGKVNLFAKGSAEEPLTETLKPGEMAELIPSKQKFTKRQVNPEVYSSWTHKKLIFQATPLADIVTLLEENYGYQVQVTDRKILSRTITGEIYIDNVNTLLVALSTSFNLKFENKDQRTLRITSPI